VTVPVAGAATPAVDGAGGVRASSQVAGVTRATASSAEGAGPHRYDFQ
jgi:hypothetical protein